MATPQNNALTVYNGRDNTLDVALTRNEVPLSADFATGFVLNVYDKRMGTLKTSVEGRIGFPNYQSGIFSTSTQRSVPGASTPINIVRMALGRVSPRIATGRAWWGELVVYSAPEPNGINWCQFYFDVIPENPAG